MEPKVRYAAVGAFVVFLGLAAAAGVVWLGQGDLSRSYDRYYCYMRESVSGLSVNGAVKYRGVSVGRVHEIILNPENSEEVRLTFDILRGTPIKQDTVAVLDTQGLTGLAIVNLSGGSRLSPPLAAKPGEKYPVIQAGPSLYQRLDQGLSRLLAEKPLTNFLGNATLLAQDARKLLDASNRAAVKRTLADAAAVAHDLAARRELIDKGVASTAQTMDEARLWVGELRHLTATLQRLADKLERRPNLILLGSPRKERGPGE